MISGHRLTGSSEGHRKVAVVSPTLLRNRFRWLWSRPALLAFVLGLLAMFGIAFQGTTNPQVPQGGSNTFPSTGTEGAANSETWDVVSASGTIVAKASAPVGWTVARSGTSFTVGAPSAATIATNYKVRYGTNATGGTTGGPGLDSASRRAPARRARPVPIDLAGRPLDGSRRTVNGPRADAGGSTGPSGAVSALFDVVAPPPPPSAPTNLTVQQRASRSTRIDLDWTDTSTNETGFKVERRTQGESDFTQIAVTLPNATHFSDKAVPASPGFDENVEYRVRATSATSGDSAYSNVATISQILNTIYGRENDSGVNFWVALPAALVNQYEPPGSFSGSDLLIVTAPLGSQGTVAFADGTSQSFDLGVAESTTIVIPRALRLAAVDGVESKGVHLTASGRVTVNVVASAFAASEGFFALPNTSLRTKYVLTSYGGRFGDNGPRFAVLATQDGTTVTVTPSVALNSNRLANIPYTVTLNAGQSYQAVSASGASPQGTVIVADRPVAVYDGHQIAQVMTGVDAGNPLTEQLKPTGTWGKRYFLTPFAGRTTDSLLRVTACKNNTVLCVGGVEVARLRAYETYQALVPGAAEIVATKPIQAIQYCQGARAQGASWSTGDPTMLALPCVEGASGSYEFCTPDLVGFPASSHYVNVVVPTGSVGGFCLDGVVIKTTDFTVIGTSGYSYAQVPVTPGEHFITNQNSTSAAAIITAYGLEYFDMYSYPLPNGPGVYGTTPDITPNAPTALTAEAKTGHDIELKWTDNASDEESFQIDRKQGANGAWTTVRSDLPAGTLSYTDGGLNPRTAYTYRVRASADFDSAWSNEASATTLNVKPAAPSGLTATRQSSTRIDLTWTDNSDNENEFLLYRKVGANGTYGAPQHLGAGTFSYQDTGLTKKTAYVYKIVASNEIGDSDPSNETTATTKDSKPDAPTNVTATAPLWNKVVLTWTDVADNETGYEIQRMEVGTTGWTALITTPANAARYEDTPVRGRTTYKYRLRAINPDADDPSDFIESAPVTTPDPPIPSAPAGLTATTISSSSIGLNWSDTSNSAAYFVIERTGGASGWTNVGSTSGYALTYTDTNLTASTTYTYRVRAGNVAGVSAGASNDASATTLDPTSAPKGIGVYATSTSTMRVTWPRVPGATGYRVYRSTSANVTTQSMVAGTVAAGSAEIVFFDDSGLANNQDYYYRVATMQGPNPSELSDQDGHFTNSGAMPWNGTATQIMNRAMQLAQPSSDDPSGIPPGNTIVLEPTQALVDDRTFSPYANASTWNPDTRVLTIDGNPVPCLEDEGGDDSSDPGQVVPAGAGGGKPLKPEGAYLKHRVLPLTATKYTSQVGVSGRFYMPTSTDSSAFGVDRRFEAPHTYLGVRFGGMNIEVGLTWYPDNVALPDRWGPYVRIQDRIRPTGGYPNNFAAYALGNNATPGRIPLDSRPALGVSAFVKLLADLRSRTIAFQIWGSDVNGIRMINSYVAYGKLPYVAQGSGTGITRNLYDYELRRVISIAQTDPRKESPPTNITPQPFTNRAALDAVGYPNGYFPSAARFRNVGWVSGKLYAGGAAYDWNDTSAWNVIPYRTEPLITTRQTGINGEPALIADLHH